MQVNFYALKSGKDNRGKSVLVIQMTLNGDTIKTKTASDYKNMARRILATDIENSNSEKNPQEWMAKLPRRFNGSYFRAEVVK